MKALHIIRREYRENVRKKSFIIGTILVPVFMASFLVLPMMFALFVPDKQYHVVVIDQTGDVGGEFVAALTDTLTDGSRKYVATSVDAPGAEYGRRKGDTIATLSESGVDIIIAVPETVFDDGEADYITKDARNLNILDEFEDALTEIVIEQRLAREGLDYSQVQSLTTGVSLEMNQVTGQGGLEQRDFLAEYGVVFVFVMLLYVTLLSWGVTISRSILEEKSTRVIEVLLSSVTPKDLLLGKVVGIGLAGMTQLLIWSLVGLLMTAYSGPVALEALESVDINPIVFVYLLVFFLLGFLLYSAIFTVVGSICNNEQDAQQLQGLVTMPMIVPILCLMLIIQSPNSPAAVVLSLIPFFSPMIMLARIVLLEPAPWQIGLSIVLLLASIYLAIAFSARVFRVGILMYGKRPNLREIIRWYRYAG